MATAKERTLATIRRLDDRGVLNKIPADRLEAYIEGEFQREAKEGLYFHGKAYVDVLTETADLIKDHYPPEPNMDDIPG